MRYPTLQISAATGMGRANLQGLLSSCSHVIFVSRNAVKFADEIAGGIAAGVRGKSVYAVGEATARELGNRGVDHVSIPEQPAGSEALLELDGFRKDQISGKEVLIVRGEDGRELLKDVLAGRGARVRYAGVYRRSMPDIARRITPAPWHDARPDVIVVTSEQGLRNLIEMTAEKDRPVLFATRLAVISDRIGALATALGFVHPPAVAEEQSDHGLLRTIDKARGRQR
jgi:uroporphyrinogen-III synthase